MMATSALFHEGELSVQTRAGLEESARNTAVAVLHSSIPPVAQKFLRNQRMVIVASIDERSRVWASVLAEQPGFMYAADDKTVNIQAPPVPGDPLSENVRHNNACVVFVVEFTTHHRMKVKGTGGVGPDGTLVVYAERVYSQCERYIQTRETEGEISELRGNWDIVNTNEPNSEQQGWIQRADTFFVASFHPATGADASHRGGKPGFVRTLDANTVIFPDYQGNSMFNTLGNITSNPHAGLLFLDFEKGNSLQLTGTAKVIWNANRISAFAGARRLVEFHMEQAIQIARNMSFRWRWICYSSYNPRLIRDSYQSSANL